MVFDWGFAAEILPELVDALGLSLRVTALSFTLALLLGMVLALGRRAQSGWVARPVSWFVEFIRRTPPLVQIYLLYFAAPAWGLQLSPFWAGSLALGLHYSCYLAEVYRAGIESIPKGQWEAAQALGMPKGLVYKDVILPQALPPVLPAMGNYLIALFKDTPLLSAITLLELLQAAKILGASYFQYLEPLTLVGLLFLVVSLTSSVGLRLLERWLPQAGLPMRHR
ncbi:MAG: ectoine/hydroxyectoine ABC transporter permease subunit EhuD [bacterium]|nr:ectoine/hydroxyectoine ABC transporter permease subunit EhuD [bacterium]